MTTETKTRGTDCISFSEVSRRTGISQNTLYKMAREGTLPGARVFRPSPGGVKPRYRIFAAEFEAEWTGKGE